MMVRLGQLGAFGTWDRVEKGIFTFMYIWEYFSLCFILS